MSLQSSPRAVRLHIGIFGRRNAGKSSLINALTDQKVSIVSDIAGTTTDPVYKAVELRGFGPAVFIDTPGLDDEGELGELRVKRTREAAERTDIALFVFTSLCDVEKEWISYFLEHSKPVIAVINKSDTLENTAEIADQLKQTFGLDSISVSAEQRSNIDTLRAALLKAAPADFFETTITGDLCGAGDLVLLVMPQDIQAPAGRLILPQVQTIRELLDKKCSIMSCTADTLEGTLKALAYPPKLIITDSQVFPLVYQHTPEESMLTSFSILFAGYKGDINAFYQGAEKFKNLKPDSRILIAEACAHSPTNEDIGRVKIPNMLKKKYGPDLQIDFVRGNDWPEDLSSYDLIIHCGACMFNRAHVLSRIETAHSQGVPICNYGITIAAATGILDKVVHA